MTGLIQRHSDHIGKFPGNPWGALCTTGRRNHTRDTQKTKSAVLPTGGLLTDGTGFLIACNNILQTQRFTFLNFLFNFVFFILTTLTPIKTTVKAITPVVVTRNHYLHSSLLRVSRFCFVLWNHSCREEVDVLKSKSTERLFPFHHN